jgi:hypothetical protein
MHRKQKYEIKNHETIEFRVDLQGPIPPVLWERAAAQQAAWNSLVGLRVEALDIWEAVRADLDDALQEFFWWLFEQAVRQQVQACRLHRESTSLVTRQFFVAHRQALDTGIALRPITSQREVQIEHIYSGRLLEKSLLSKRAWRVAVNAWPPASAYAANDRACQRARRVTDSFGFDPDTHLKFRMNLHRPFPPGSILKRVTLIGRQKKSQRWTWALAITVELPR